MGDKIIVTEPGDKIVTDGDSVEVKPKEVQKKKVTVTETTEVRESDDD